MKGKQAVYIMQKNLPAAPAVKEQAQLAAPNVTSVKAKSRPTANQHREVAPVEKQGQNAKSVPSSQANSSGSLNFAKAASRAIESRTDVEARMKTMEESLTALVKLLHERLPSPDPSPPAPRI